VCCGNAARKSRIIARMPSTTHNTDALPDDVAQLKALVGIKDHQIAALQEELRLLIHKRFGASSEKADPAQLQLFNEAEATPASAPDAVEAAGEITVPEHTREKRGRKPLPSILPRVRIEHDIADVEKVCPCGCTLSRIGEETSEQLDIEPAKIQVLQHVRFKYACRRCEGSAHDGPAVTIAPVAAQPIPKSNASPGLLAHIVTAKTACRSIARRRCSRASASIWAAAPWQIG
jgi:transposase